MINENKSKSNFVTLPMLVAFQTNLRKTLELHQTHDCGISSLRLLFISNAFI